MKLRKILAVALVPLLLVVAGGQSALAYSWSPNNGIDCSSGTYTEATWTSGHMTSGTIDRYLNQQYSWGNLFYNRYSKGVDVYARWNGGLTSAGSQYAGFNLDPGVTYDNMGVTASVTQSIPFDNWPASLNVWHQYYFNDGYTHVTEFWTGQVINGRK